jgi:long-chain fatty acid transport protein
MAIYFQPTISYKITETLGIGAGFIYAYGDVELNKGFPLQNQNGEEGQINVNGSTANYGFNAGLYFQPSETFSLGVTYRSEIMMEVEGGDATFSVPSSLATMFPETNKFNADLPMPASVNVGAAYGVSDQLTLALDVNYVFWSTYESLDFDFEENTASLQDLSQPKNYNDGAIYHIGAEYLFDETWTFRAGFYYDSPVVPDDYYAPETPDAVKLGYTAGLSFSPNRNLSVDASFLFVQGLERDVNYKPENFGGTYKYFGFVPGIGINYQF